MAEAARVAATLPKLRLYVCHVSGDMASGLRLGFALERVPLWRQPRVLPPAGRGMRRTHRAHSACANASPRAPRKALGARSQVCAWGLPLNGLPRGALPQAPKVLPPKGCGWQGGGARWCGSGTPSPRAPRQALGGRLAAPCRKRGMSFPRNVAVGREGEREGMGLAPPGHAHRGERWALRLARPVHRLRGDAKTAPVACLGHGLRCRRRGNNATGGSPRGALPQAPHVFPPKGCSRQGGGARGGGSGTHNARAHLISQVT